MTELIINGTRAVLPEDIKFPLFEENPYFTRNGEFSLDITMSLMNPVNAKIFRHINRLNLAAVMTEADAILIVDNKVSKGRIVDFENTDTTVTYQFVAGNSELNFLSQNNKKIWQLDFGTEDVIHFAKIMLGLNNPGYGPVIEDEEEIAFNRFVCVPVKYSNLTANDFTLEVGVVESPGQINGVNNIVMQPYLMYYIDKLPELLGYELESNVLMSDDFARSLFFTNPVQSNNYSDALPDITIGEFISAIEEFFNVFYYVTAQKKCYILNKNSYIDDMPVVKLTKVLDAYERTNNDENVSVDAIAYDLSGSGYHKYQKIDPEIIRVSELLQYNSAFFMKNLVSSPQLNKFIIHLTTNNNRQHIYTPDPELNVYRVLVPSEPGSCLYVNKFQNYGDSESPKTLAISPLAYTAGTKEYWLITDGIPMLVDTLPYQLPVENNNLYTSDSQNILEAVEGELQAIPRKSKIEVGIYSGMIELFNNTGVLYPVSYVDTMPEFFTLDNDRESAFNTWITNVYAQTCTMTLRLIGDDGIYNRYHVNYDIDSTTVYTFNVLDEVSIGKLYDYNGSIYIPFSIEKTVGKTGAEKEKKVKFYKLK